VNTIYKAKNLKEKTEQKRLVFSFDFLALQIVFLNLK